MKPQQTDQWMLDRVGKLTASRIADAFARTKSGWGASRKNYMAELVAERLTGVKNQGFTNAAMQWGIDTEPEARAHYEFIEDVEVVEVGFIDHPSIKGTGASPDGLVDATGMVEIKCPNTATHIETLLTERIPDRYVKQMIWQMVCADRDWCDFVSYDPRLPPSMQYFCKRLERDEKVACEYEKMAEEFLAELDDTVSRLKEKYGVKHEH